MGRLTEYIYLLNNPKKTKDRFCWIDFEWEKSHIKLEKTEKEIKKQTKDIFGLVFGNSK